LKFTLRHQQEFEDEGRMKLKLKMMPDEYFFSYN